ncbi:hypothetical protein APR41_16065 [Salegentibacter salinarum]|uniref:HTH cro/C1-type domain-containing protein n=1 Tax=Salegentibacter salinarum TaxID=447422 RepID=A0A2N0TXJ4_9FLAO|nr:helix-turn-helix transcriptional regulator [Salegentibacter salinarum]PKD19475.1 hypothetical protein APR41_16065 [Salegentibacter salinarum]SKB91766.1 Helix-turn-helix [Salegentibacter salinarum]
MKVGDNIREIREVERNYKRSFVAKSLQISTRAYGNIENNITDLTLDRLEEIAKILECSPIYILNYKDYKKKFYDHFREEIIRKTSLINQQVYQNPPSQKIIILQEELLKSERNRIALLEALLRNYKIKF